MAERIDAQAARLQSALERIARAAGRAPAQDGTAEQALAAARLREQEVAARLDALIAGLRDALRPQG